MDYKKQGKKNKASGARFELKVRKDLESKGWIVSKWQNNVELPYDIPVSENPKTKCECIPKRFIGKLIPAKRKFNPFKKILGIGTGFPDFIAYQNMNNEENKAVFGIVDCGILEKDSKIRLSGIIGVEAKLNGMLDKEEKLKCKWLLDNKIFSKILIAMKDYPEDNINLMPEKRKPKQIKYEEFK